MRWVVALLLVGDLVEAVEEHEQRAGVERARQPVRATALRTLGLH